MLQASIGLAPFPRTPIPEGSTSTTESTSKSLRREETPPLPPPFPDGGVKTEATAQLSNDRKRSVLPDWHALFRHINHRCFVSDGRNYRWTNADRKILYNAARKYGAAAILAMWDIYFEFRGGWFASTGGTIYGMVRDSARILDHAEFKLRQREHQSRLDQAADAMSAADVLEQLSLKPRAMVR